MPDIRIMMLRNYCSKVEHRGQYLLPDICMMILKKYYSKVEHRGRYGIPDVRMTKNYYGWASGTIWNAGCSHDDVKKLL
jgi:hypothetical protein